MFRSIATILFLTVLITGCVSEKDTQLALLDTSTVPPPSSTSVINNTITPLVVVSNTMVPTVTQMPPCTSTLKPVVTSRLPSDAKLDFKCVEIQPEETSKMNNEGMIIFSSQTSSPSSPSQPQNSIVILDSEDERYSHFAVSPDRTMIAYRKMVLDNEDRILEDQLVVLNSSGQVLASTPFQDEHWGNLSWLNNQLLNIRYFDAEADTRRWSGVQFVDPFSGQVVFGDWPTDVYLDAGSLPWDIPLVYDPALLKVAYPSSLNTGEPTIALWDVETQKLISEYPADLFASRDGPVWSPDGKQFIFVMSDKYGSPPPWKQELFSISRDGQLERLTYLTNYYRQVSISHFAWSPNGKYVAFWITDELSEKKLQEIAILDIAIGKVTNYCITEGETPYDAHIPIWSPNSQQLLIVQLSSDRTAQTILVDIAVGSAYQIAEKLVPRAWIISPP